MKRSALSAASLPIINETHVALQITIGAHLPFQMIPAKLRGVTCLFNQHRHSLFQRDPSKILRRFFLSLFQLSELTSPCSIGEIFQGSMQWGLLGNSDSFVTRLLRWWSKANEHILKRWMILNECLNKNCVCYYMKPPFFKHL